LIRPSPSRQATAPPITSGIVEQDMSGPDIDAKAANVAFAAIAPQTFAGSCPARPPATAA
jgi:hypothetical protein